MAGGTWNRLVGKERPGTYINFATTERNIVGIGERGIVLLPLFGHNYGPAGEFITLENESPDAQYSKLGYSVYEKPLLLVKEAFKCAKKVIVYIPAQGDEASGTVALEYEPTEISIAVSKAADNYLGAKADMEGCTLDYSDEYRRLSVTLTGPVSGVKNTGIFDTIGSILNDGYTITVKDTPITSAADFVATSTFRKLNALAPGDDIFEFSAVVSKDGESETYFVYVDYPNPMLRAASGEKPGNILTGRALYGGTRGNDISFDCVENEEDGYDVNIYMENDVVETFEKLHTVADLMDAGSTFIKFLFSGNKEAALSAFSAISLEGGTAGRTTTLSVTRFLDASEAQTWTTMAFPWAPGEDGDKSLLTALVSKIKYLREDVGKYRQVVLADYTCDYEGVINVCNSYELSDGTKLTNAQATAWVAGATAGADCVTSNTYKVVEDAADVVGLLTHSETVVALKRGRFVFSFNEKQEVAVEYDINSLTSYNDGKKAQSWRKGRVLRVLDSFGESCQVNFPPNKYDNDEDGWDIMEGIGKTILKLYGPKSDGGIGAIRNVDYDNDFLVDRELSHGDEVYFNVGIQPVDSAEKLFFTVTTR